MEARERFLLRQKLAEYEEQKRQDWGKLPRVNSRSDDNTIDRARRKVEEIETLRHYESLALRQPQPGATDRVATTATNEANKTESPVSAAPANPVLAGGNGGVTITSNPPPASLQQAGPQPAPEGVVTPPVLSPVGKSSGYPLKSKQERLTEVLNLFKADKITAAEYLERRARIISEP